MIRVSQDLKIHCTDWYYTILYWHLVYGAQDFFFVSIDTARDDKWDKHGRRERRHRHCDENMRIVGYFSFLFFFLDCSYSYILSLDLSYLSLALTLFHVFAFLGSSFLSWSSTLTLSSVHTLSSILFLSIDLSSAPSLSFSLSLSLLCTWIYVWAD